uniref:Uncharacterized protein n=1 Tax=Ficedula albicollis TaxID=59894 RepID=A0A803UZV5_FICAL
MWPEQAGCRALRAESGCSLYPKVFSIPGWSSCETQDSSCPLCMCSVPAHEQVFHWNDPTRAICENTAKHCNHWGEEARNKTAPAQTKGDPQDIQCIPPPWKSARALDLPHLCKPKRDPKTESKERYTAGERTRILGRHPGSCDVTSRVTAPPHGSQSQSPKGAERSATRAR